MEFSTETIYTTNLSVLYIVSLCSILPLRKHVYKLIQEKVKCFLSAKLSRTQQAIIVSKTVWGQEHSDRSCNTPT